MSSNRRAEEFIAASKSDNELSSEIMKIFESHGSAAAKEILQLAHRRGFDFSQNELEESVRESAAKEIGGEGKPGPNFSDRTNTPPESACSRGCLSYTHNWHPEPIFL
jgi:hypothetical protein